MSDSTSYNKRSPMEHERDMAGNAEELALISKKLEQLDAAATQSHTLYKSLQGVLQTVPRTREISVAITELETSMLWAQHGMTVYKEQLMRLKEQMEQ